MPKLKIKNGDVVIVPGTGAVDFGADTGVMPFGATALVKTANFTLGVGGVYNLSSSTAAITASLPDATNKVGVRYHIVTTSAHAHNVTASNVAGGETDGIANYAGSSTDFDGYALLKFEADVGKSLIVESNGTVWQAITLSSGSHTLSQD